MQQTNFYILSKYLFSGNYIYSQGHPRTGATAMLEPRAIARAPEGEGCPRCGGYVYAAEQKLARGRVRKYLINMSKISC